MENKDDGLNDFLKYVVATDQLAQVMDHLKQFVIIYCPLVQQENLSIDIDKDFTLEEKDYTINVKLKKAKEKGVKDG